MFTANLKNIGRICILIVWQWIEHSEDEEHSTSEDDLQCDSLSTDSDLSESDSERNKTSTVSFKCVGDWGYQRSKLPRDTENSFKTNPKTQRFAGEGGA